MTLDNKNIPSLDGIRGYSILLVFLSHIGFGNLIPGGLGVTIFFFISGFLITKLSLFELRKNLHFNFRAFYLRRFFRLYPALILFLLFIVLFFLVIQRPFILSEFSAALFYYVNYAWVFWVPSHVDQWHGIFKILWSLAIEEHFYLFFPVIFVLTYKKASWFYFTSFIIMLACLLFRIYYSKVFGNSPELELYNYSLTHTRVDSIMYGCVLAFALYNGHGVKIFKILSNKSLFALAILTLIFTLLYRDPIFRQTYRYSLQGFALFVIIPNIVFTEWKLLRFFFENKLIVEIGKLSYSIYLFHWFSMFLGNSLYPGLTVGWYFIVIVMTILFSYFSFNYIEKPFVKLRRNYGSNVQLEKKR